MYANKCIYVAVYSYKYIYLKVCLIRSQYESSLDADQKMYKENRLLGTT